MGKRFKTPLEIRGTRKELENLIPDLKNIGYRLNEESYRDGDPLVTNTAFGSHTMQYCSPRYSSVLNRIKVRASNKDLVLALAEMVDSDDLYAGEWCICKAQDQTTFTNGKLYQAFYDGWETPDSFLDDTGRLSGFAVGNGNKRLMPKATVEEILGHFRCLISESGEVLTEGVSGETVSTKEVPVYYEVIKEWPGGPEKGTHYVYSQTKGDYEVLENDNIRVSHHKASSFPEFFQPIFKPKSITIQHDNGLLEVEFKDGLAWCKGCSFNKKQLEIMVAVDEIGSNADVKVRATQFEFGCSGQYKGITAESIKKIIDLL